MSSGRITRANQQSIQRGQQRRGVVKDETGVGREDGKVGRLTRSTKEAAEAVSKEKEEEKETGRVTRARTVLSASVVNGVGLRARRRSTVPAKEDKPVIKEEITTATDLPVPKRILEVVIPASPTMPVNATASSSSPTPKGMSLRRGRTDSVSTASVTSSVVDHGLVKTRTSTRMKRQKEESVAKAVEGPGVDREADEAKKVVELTEAPETRRRSRSATSSGLSSPAEETFVKIEPLTQSSTKTEPNLDVEHETRPSSPARQPPVDVSLAVTAVHQVEPAHAPSPLVADISCDIIPMSVNTSNSAIATGSVPPCPLAAASIPARSNRPTSGRPQTAAAERSSRRSVKRSSSPMKPVETSSAVHSLRSTKGQSRRACEVPFPPLDLLDPDHGGLAISPEEKENGSLVADDMKDEKLLAVCAALDLFGNRALTATEIGDACVNQGWMRPSPALPSSSLVQSAIRAYQRRCATHHPERICLIRKHILAGYAMESRLIPALHPSAAQDGCRRKGMVFYLEGQIGNRVWSNPFDTLQDEDGTSDSMQIDKPAQEARSGKHTGINKRKQTRGKIQPQTASTQVDDVEMEVERPPLRDRPSGLKIKIKLGGVYNGTMESAPYTPPEDDFAMMVERDTTDDDSDEEGSTSEEYSEEESVFAGQEDSYAFPEYGEDESEDSDDADNADELPRNTSIKDLARSFFMDSPPEAMVTEPLSNHVRFSPLPSPAMSVFPTNPLDSGIFDDTDYMPALSPPDEQTGSSSEDEDEAATEFMDTLDYGRLKMSNTSTKRVNFHPMAYRDAFSPTDLDGSEIDTPATTPRTYCDDEDEPDVPKCGTADEPMDADVADVDDDLQKAVQVLGQLLPDFSDPSESIHGSHRSGLQATNILESMKILANQQEVVDSPSQSASSRFSTRRRKSSIGARDFLRLSLPFPLCPAPSPLQSPAVPNHLGLDADVTRYQSLDQMDDATALRTIDSDKERHAASDMELLPDLDQQLALADCELACVCNPEPSNSASMRVDPLSHAAGMDESGTLEDKSGSHEHDLMEDMEDRQSWADLLGPESVGLEELDNVWGFMNAAVAAVASGQPMRRRKGEADSRSVASTRSDSSDKTLQQKDIWGAIGVGGVGPSRRIEQARFRKALLTKAKALVGAKLSTSPISPRKTQRPEQNAVDEEEAIGLEDVADAFISAWADGDTILEEDSLDYQSPNATVADIDEEMTFTAGLYAGSSDDPIGVSPSVLTNSVTLDVVASPKQDGASKSDTCAKPLHLAAKHARTASDACPVTSQASPVTHIYATHPKVDLPLQAGGSSPASGNSVSNLVTVPGISTRFPIKLPAPPRPNAHARPPAITESDPLKSGPQQNPVAISSDLVSLTSVPWKGPSSCRRFVPDYVNFSAVLRAVKHPDIAEVEEQVQRIPTSVTLRDGPPLANGIWLPMDVAESEAERVNIIPNDLRDLSLRAGLRCQLQSSSIRDQTVAASESADTPARTSRGSDQTLELPSDTPRSRSVSPSVGNSKPPEAPLELKMSTITPSKRFNPSVLIKSSEPATKRRKSSITSAPLDSTRPLTRAQKHNSRKSPA